MATTEKTQADHAFAALVAYRRSTTDNRSKVDIEREGGDLTEEVLTDLLADLRHLCDELDLDYDENNERGGWHYGHEVG